MQVQRSPLRRSKEPRLRIHDLLLAKQSLVYGQERDLHKILRIVTVPNQVVGKPVHRRATLGVELGELPTAALLI